MQVRNVIAISLLSFKEGYRQRILYGMLLFALLLISFSVLGSGLFMRDIGKVTVDFCLTAVSLGGLVVPFFIAVNLLAGDLQRRTVYSLLARSISRQEYIVGKFGGLLLLTGAIVAILAIGALTAIWGSHALYGNQYFSNLNWASIFLSFVATFFGLMMFNAVVILWSCLTTSSFFVTLLTIATYIVGQTMEDMMRFMSVKIPGVEISPVIHKAVKLALYIFPNLAAFDLKLTAAHGLAIPAREVLFLGSYAASYTIAALCLAVLFFQKRDLS